MLDKLDDYMQRPMRYQNIDGIGEMGIGFLWLGIGVLQMLHATALENSVWHWKGTFLLGVVTVWLVVRYGRGILKKRITYPRTGFVKYRGLAGKPWLASLLACAIATPSTILSYLLFRHSSASVIVAVIAAGFGFLYVLGSRLDAAWRWVVLVVMVVGPVAISTLALDREWQHALSIGFLGLTYFVSGVIAFCLYLRRTRPAEQEAE
jgi:positive regulator of sigma E activity